MSIKKTYNSSPYLTANFEAALKDIQAISYSLEQSIGLTSISPKYLKKIEAQNQVYYHASECQTPEETDKFIEAWCADMNVESNSYRTGGGLGFDWHIDRENKSVTITLVHPHGWHKESTLLSRAWLAGYRGELGFAYNTQDARKVIEAVHISEAFHQLRIYHAGVERCLEAVRNDTLPQLLIELANEVLAIRKKSNHVLNANSDLSDDELLGIK
jgi:hypothetical protein